MEPLAWQRLVAVEKVIKKKVFLGIFSEMMVISDNVSFCFVLCSITHVIFQIRYHTNNP